MERPRIKRTVGAVHTPDGNLIFVRAGERDDVEVEQPSDEERRLLESLDGSNSLDELRSRFGSAEVDEAFASLCEVDLLEDAAEDDRLTPRVLDRFDRQLRYFGELARSGGITPVDCQERLGRARVSILGVGGLGGRVALDLASCGIGELHLVDGDRVELSNLNRQTQYGEADIGIPKVEAMARRLREFNSDVDVSAAPLRMESEEDVARCITGADIVVDAADWPQHEIERWCNSACFKAGIPYIAMSHFPPVVRVGPLYVPGRTGCFACQDSQYRAEFPLYDIAIEQLRANASPAGTLGPACGVAGGLVAAEVMHFLTGLVSPPMIGAGFVVDLRTLEVDRYEVVPRADCQICGNGANGPIDRGGRTK